MQQLRWDAMDKLLIQDKSVISENEVSCPRFSCSEKHPGLCATLHSAIYERTLDFAAKLEAFFLPERLCAFWCLRLRDAEGTPFSLSDSDIVVYFSHRRRRRFHAQVTHVWVRCMRLADGDFALKQQAKCGVFDFLNAWILDFGHALDRERRGAACL
jgi:hypothetical protein